MDRPIETCEVVIGTDNSGNIDDEPAPELLKEAPTHTMAEVELTMQSLRAAVDGEPYSIDVVNVSRICDTVCMWASTESYFPQEPSVLMECDALPTLLPLLNHARSPIVISSLQCLEHILKHPTQMRLARQLVVDVVVADEDGNTSGAKLGIAELLFRALRKFPNKEEVQFGGIAVAVQVAKVDVEAFLVGDIIAATLASMKQHKAIATIQALGCELLASLVSCDRKDPKDIPVAILFVQIGSITDFLFGAFKAHPNNTRIIDAVARCFAVFSNWPQNREELISTDILNVATKIVDGSRFNLPALRDGLTTIMNMVPEMDTLQKRSVIITTRNTMSKVAETAILARCCALSLVTVRSFVPAKPENDSQDEAERFQREADEEVAMKRFCAENIVPFILLALEHYGDLDETLQKTGEVALRCMVISKWM